MTHHARQGVRRVVELNPLRESAAFIIVRGKSAGWSSQAIMRDFRETAANCRRSARMQSCSIEERRSVL